MKEQLKKFAPTDDPVLYWKPVHDQMIALHLGGYTHEQIALATQYTAGHVKRILRDPRAQKAIAIARRRIFGTALVTIQERMVGLGVEAIENIAETIEEDFEAGTKGKRHQDDVSFELLARIGFGRKEAEGSGGGINLPPEEARRFVDAVEKANRAREIHALPPAEYEEVESSELESDNGRGLGETDGRDGDIETEVGS